MVEAHVAVIGGGPAGLIAAERLTAAGHRVTVYEQRRSVGRKFLLAGRGGLNITHSEDLDAFLTRYEPLPRPLEQAIRQFSPTALQAWCAALDEPTFVGSSGRVFPASFRATPLLRAWLIRLQEQGVRIMTGHRWLGWHDGSGLRIEDPAGVANTVEASATLFALGGASWPRVGSDGSWVDEFVDAGIEVAPLQPANCGIGVRWSPQLRQRFEGAPLKNTALTAGDRTVRGDPIITAGGLEGGPVYALGPALRAELQATGTALVTIDFHPDQSHERLGERLAKRRPKSSTSSWLRSAGLHDVEVAVLRDITGNNLPADPWHLAKLAKAAPVHVNGMAPIDRAISTAGGVTFDAVDSRFMLRAKPGCFVAGEMLNWEAPTGGYLLQGCFSTGVAAADGIINHLR